MGNFTAPNTVKPCDCQLDFQWLISSRCRFWTKLCWSGCVTESCTTMIQSHECYSSLRPEGFCQSLATVETHNSIKFSNSWSFGVTHVTHHRNCRNLKWSFIKGHFQVNLLTPFLPRLARRHNWDPPFLWSLLQRHIQTFKTEASWPMKYYESLEVWVHMRQVGYSKLM